MIGVLCCFSGSESLMVLGSAVLLCSLFLLASRAKSRATPARRAVASALKVLHVERGAIGDTRDVAIRRMRRALGEFMIQGIKTTIPLQSKIMTTSDSQQGKYDSTWVENFLAQEGLKGRCCQVHDREDKAHMRAVSGAAHGGAWRMARSWGGDELAAWNGGRVEAEDKQRLDGWR